MKHKDAADGAAISSYKSESLSEKRMFPLGRRFENSLLEFAIKTPHTEQNCIRFEGTWHLDFRADHLGT